MIHELKSHPEPFDAVVAGVKTYEVRKADRAYKVGDRLFLRRWDPARSDYTGHGCYVDVVHLTPGGRFGLPDDLCVMGIALLPPTFQTAD